MTIHCNRRVGRMKLSILFWSVVGFLCLLSVVRVPQVAAQATELTFDLFNRQLVPPGGQVPLYYVELQDDFGGSDAQIRVAGPGNGFNFTISDLVGTSTGLQFTDFSAFNVFRSSDAAWDSGDQLEATFVPVGLGLQTIPGAGMADPDVPEDPASVYFIITAVISLNATVGHSFRFDVAGGHIDMSQVPGGPFVRGTAIAASDAIFWKIGYLQIYERSIPVGYEWVAGLGFFGYGTYYLLRRKRGKTHT